VSSVTEKTEEIDLFEGEIFYYRKQEQGTDQCANRNKQQRVAKLPMVLNK
jgi:hypothetical protein